jgi:hypothetical protein
MRLAATGRPRDSRAAKQCDELAPPHSITGFRMGIVVVAALAANPEPPAATMTATCRRTISSHSRLC